MLGYLSADIICSEKQTVFRERSSRKTVSFKEQIMSKDKYPSIFSPQMEAIVFIIQFWLGDIWSCDCLDQSRVSEKIWWIVKEHKPSYRRKTYHSSFKVTSAKLVSTTLEQMKTRRYLFMCIDHKFMEHQKSKHLNYLSPNPNMSSLFSIIPFL